MTCYINVTSGVPGPRASASEERSPTPELSQDKTVTTAEKKLHDVITTVIIMKKIIYFFRWLKCMGT